MYRAYFSNRENLDCLYFVVKIYLSVVECKSVMKFTKTDFLQFLHYPNSLWLLKHQPEKYPVGEFSEFPQKLTAEGYEVESYIRKLISARKDAKQYSFQRVFKTKRGLYAKADMVRDNGDGSLNLYEVKSSTKVKSNHISDCCFQMIAAHEFGAKIRDIFVVHLNSEYVRNGDIAPEELFTFVKVTSDVIEHF